MDFEALPVIALVAGIVLLYGAITNHNPIEVIKLALTGGDINSAAPLMVSTSPDAPGPGARDGATLPGTPQADGDARTDPPSFDPERDDILPNYGGSPGNPNAGAIVYRQPFNPGNKSV